MLEYRRPKFETAQQQAYNYLRDQILAGHYSAGMRLKPESVSKVLGISSMPVREAIRQLDAEGLVTIQPNRGASITSLTLDEILEVFEMRAVLEGLAVRTAVPNIGSDELADLTALCDRMDRVRDDPAEWITRHNDFHEALCMMSGRPRLAKQITHSRNAVRPYLLMYMNVFPDSPTGFEHGDLMDVIGRGEPHEADEAMQLHIMSHAEELVEFLLKKDPHVGKSKARPEDALASSGA